MPKLLDKGKTITFESADTSKEDDIISIPNYEQSDYVADLFLQLTVASGTHNVTVKCKFYLDNSESFTTGIENTDDGTGIEFTGSDGAEHSTLTATTSGAKYETRLSFKDWWKVAKGFQLVYYKSGGTEVTIKRKVFGR